MQDKVVSTISELAATIGIDEQQLAELVANGKIKLQNPPYNPGAILMELLTKGIVPFSHIQPEEGMEWSEPGKLVAIHVAQKSLENAAVGELLENLAEEPSFKKAIESEDAEIIDEAVRMSGRLPKKSWLPIERSDRLAIAIARPKSAALFFDRIWTLDRSIPKDVGFRIGTVNERVALGMIDGLAETFEEFDGFTSENVDEVIWSFVEKPEVEALMHSTFRKTLNKDLQQQSNHQFCDYFSSEQGMKGVYASGNTGMILTAIESAKGIDESKLQWDQVREIRADNEASLRLRRMLHWCDTHLIGKDVKFIEDEICLRIAEYDEAARKHGITLSSNAIGYLIDEKVLLPLLSAIAVGFFDSKSISIEGAAVGIGMHLIMVGKETVRLHRERNSLHSQDPFAYLHSFR
jgi:hypothetical protein